jgi:hypothetical protein
MERCCLKNCLREKSLPVSDDSCTEDGPDECSVSGVWVGYLCCSSVLFCIVTSSALRVS